MLVSDSVVVSGEFPSYPSHFCEANVANLSAFNELLVEYRGWLVQQDNFLSIRLLPSDFICSLLQGVLTIDSAKIHLSQILYTHLILLQVWQQTLVWGRQSESIILQICHTHACHRLKMPHLAVFGNLCGESRSPISKGGLGGPELIWWLTAGPLLIWFVTAAHVAVWFSMSPVWKRVLVSCTEKMMYNNNHASWHALICQHEISNWLRKSGKTANIDKTQQLV